MLTDNGSDEKTIHDIELVYTDYISNKDKVIALYKAGERQAGAHLHKDVRRQFFNIPELCEDYK